MIGAGVLLLVVALMPQLALGQQKESYLPPLKGLDSLNVKRNDIKIERTMMDHMMLLPTGYVAVDLETLKKRVENPPQSYITKEKAMRPEARQELLDIWTRMIFNIGDPDYHLAIYNDIRSFIYKGGNLSFSQYDRNNGTVDSLLSRAVEKQDKLLVRLLLTTDISANTVMNYITGETVLMRAVRMGNKDIIDTLVRAGADVTAKDVFGNDVQAYIEMWKKDVEKMLSK